MDYQYAAICAFALVSIPSTSQFSFWCAQFRTMNFRIVHHPSLRLRMFLLFLAVVWTSLPSAICGEATIPEWRKSLLVRAEKQFDDLLDCIDRVQDTSDSAKSENLPILKNQRRTSSPLDCLQKVLILDFRRLVKVAYEVEEDNVQLNEETRSMKQEVEVLKFHVTFLQNTTAKTAKLRRKLTLMKNQVVLLQNEKEQLRINLNLMEKQEILLQDEIGQWRKNVSLTTNQTILFQDENEELRKNLTWLENKNILLQNETTGLNKNLTFLKNQEILLQTEIEQLRAKKNEISQLMKEKTCEADLEAVDVSKFKKCIAMRRMVAEQRARFPNKAWNDNMHMAINGQNETMLTLAVELGADVNARANLSDLHYDSGRLFSPLELALKNYNTQPGFSLKAMKFLIRKGANSTAQGLSGDIFLSTLISSINQTEFEDIMSFLISQNLSHLFNARGLNGKTSFQRALDLFEIERKTLDHLHQIGIDFNAVDSKDGFSVFHWAVIGDRSLQMISDLVSLGADPLHRTKKGTSALHFAAMYCGNTVVKYLIDLGLDVNSRNAEGYAPLMYAALGRYTLENARVLIENGADVKMKFFPLGETILSVILRRDAAKKDLEKIIKLFKDNE